MASKRSRLRFVMAIGLFLLVLLLGLLIVFVIVSHIGSFVLGGPDRVRDMWRGERHETDSILFYVSMCAAVVGGSILALWGWCQFLVRTRWLRDVDAGNAPQNDPKDVPMKPIVHGSGFQVMVIWPLLVVILAGGFALIGYHLANFPYEGWEGMRRHLQFPAILVPKYPFRVLPLLALILVGAVGAWLAEKIFNKLFAQK